MVLIYVDVIEFDGTHIRKFYTDLTKRYAAYLKDQNEIASRLRPGVSALSALRLSTRIFFNYFCLEILFNVPEPFGKDSMEIVREIADILRYGILP